MMTGAEDGLVPCCPCKGCACGTAMTPLTMDAPGLLPADEFPEGTCVRFQIEWSLDVKCRPVGFVVSSDRGHPLRPVSIAGQDVPTMPQALGGGVIGMPTTDRCECPECCEKSGTAALDFGSGGGPIPEGSDGQVEGLAGSERTCTVTVHEAHVHEDCSRALAWSAIVDEL